jgi:hypothetical protein
MSAPATLIAMPRLRLPAGEESDSLTQPIGDAWLASASSLSVISITEPSVRFGTERDFIHALKLLCTSLRRLFVSKEWTRSRLCILSEQLN